jgi:hypothetical protein
MKYSFHSLIPSTAVSRNSLNYFLSWSGILGADTTENTVSIVIAQQYLDCCHCISCRGNLFIESLPSRERLLWLHYSGFQASCHNIISTLTASWNSKAHDSSLTDYRGWHLHKTTHDWFPWVYRSLQNKQETWPSHISRSCWQQTPHLPNYIPESRDVAALSCIGCKVSAWGSIRHDSRPYYRKEKLKQPAHKSILQCFSTCGLLPTYHTWWLVGCRMISRK